MGVEFVDEWKSVKSDAANADVGEASGSDCDEVSENLSEKLKLSSGAKCPEILTGGCIEDRKSVFQPHFARVNSMEEVKLVTTVGIRLLDRFGIQKLNKCPIAESETSVVSDILAVHHLPSNLTHRCYFISSLKFF